MKPVQKDAPIPELKEIATAITDAQTDVAPLIPHSQGVSALARWAPSFIPSGNGVPINNPRGNIIASATTIRTGFSEERNAVVAGGVNTPKATTAASRARSLRRPPALRPFPIDCVK